MDPSDNITLLPHEISVQRPIFTQTQFQKSFGFEEPKPISMQTKMSAFYRRRIKPSKSCLQNSVLKTFPIINTLRSYQLREYLLNDVIAGLSVGIVHIPQGMGFSLLASVPPVYGLYSSFFPVLLYTFLGSSRHITIGTMALIAILIGTVVEREVDHYKNSLVVNNSSVSVDSPEIARYSIGVATAVSLLVGLFQTALSLLRLDVVTAYLSDAFIGGFTTGAAFQIVTSQITLNLGISICTHSGPLNMVYKYVEIFSRIVETNVADVIISIVSAAIIIFFREAVNERFKSKMRVPIPVELLVVLVATTLSHFCEFQRHFAIGVVGEIPSGFPMPSVPPMDRAGSFVVDAFIISVVGLVISIALAKLFSRLYNYELDMNQEMFAHGIAHTVSSFFLCYAGCAAPPRCMVFDGSRGKTQVANLFSVLLLFFVILYIGPLFYSLPKSVLGTIIIVSLKNMFLQLKDLRTFWCKDKFDFSIWLVTLLSVVLLDMSLGLVIGVGYSLLTVVLRTQLGSHSILGHAVGTEFYVPLSYQDCSQHDGIVIYRGDTPICFTNAESFKNNVYMTVTNPDILLEDSDHCHTLLATRVVDAGSKEVNTHNLRGMVINEQISESQTVTANVDIDTNHDEADSTFVDDDDSVVQTEFILAPNGGENIKSTSYGGSNHIRALIIDCSSVSFIDTAGANVLRLMAGRFAVVGISFVLAACNHTVLLALKRNGYLATFGADVYMSVHDAVVAMQLKLRKTCVQ